MIYREIFNKYIQTIVYKEPKLKSFSNKLQNIPIHLQRIIVVEFLRFNSSLDCIDDLNSAETIIQHADYKSFSIDFRGKTTTFYRIMIDKEDFTSTISNKIARFNYLDSDIIVSFVNMNQKDSVILVDMIMDELSIITESVFSCHNSDMLPNISTPCSIDPLILFILSGYTYLSSVGIEKEEDCIENLVYICENILCKSLIRKISMSINSNDKNVIKDKCLGVSKMILNEYKDGTYISDILDYGYIELFKYQMYTDLDINTATIGWGCK